MRGFQAAGGKAVGSDATGLAVLEAADRLHGRVAKALAPAGLSYEAYRVLAHLARSKDALDVYRLASVGRRGGSTVVEILNALEAEGLVRVVDGGQGRNARAQVTDLGVARAYNGSKQLDRTAAEFASALDAPDRAALGRLFGRLPTLRPQRSRVGEAALEDASA
jgi:DNA-binding MarR family transcriptional regulator